MKKPFGDKSQATWIKQGVWIQFFQSDRQKVNRDIIRKNEKEDGL